MATGRGRRRPDVRRSAMVVGLLVAFTLLVALCWAVVRTSRWSSSGPRETSSTPWLLGGGGYGGGAGWDGGCGGGDGGGGGC